jgi:thioredoxin-related protein
MRSELLRLLLFLSFVSCIAFAQETSVVPKQDAEQREKFDPAKDPRKDLQKAIAVAKKSGQRILLDVGGEWCSWCHKLDKFFQENKDVSDFLQKNFVVVKVNYSKENKNEKFLSRFPKVEGYPHLFVMSNRGKLLRSQETGALESGDHHDHDKVLAFLKKWAPKKVKNTSVSGS